MRPYSFCSARSLGASLASCLGGGLLAGCPTSLGFEAAEWHTQQHGLRSSHLAAPTEEDRRTGCHQDVSCRRWATRTFISCKLATSCNQFTSRAWARAAAPEGQKQHPAVLAHLRSWMGSAPAGCVLLAVLLLVRGAAAAGSPRVRALSRAHSCSFQPPLRVSETLCLNLQATKKRQTPCRWLLVWEP